MILDTGFLVSVDRGDRSAHAFVTAAANKSHLLHTTEAIVAQVWRSGPRQARLAKFLKTLTIHPLDDGRAVGSLLARSGTSDVVDAHLLITAIRLGCHVLTGDPKDLSALAATAGAAATKIHAWP